MNIGGFQKLTLLDYPGYTACTIFTTGCNMRCPFCHNSKLAKEQYNTIAENVLFDFLKSRVGLLDGVCISGGEPTLQKDLKLFIQNIKDLGYLVKLDTNGTNTNTMIDLVESGYIDYVAMDIKNSFDKYSMTCGIQSFYLGNIKRSIDYLLHSSIDYEFRTTIVKNYHTKTDVKLIANEISGCKNYYMQKFVKSNSIIDSRCEEQSDEEFVELYNEMKQYIPNVQLRGVSLV